MNHHVDTIRKYDPIHKSIDIATNRKFPLEIVDIITSYATHDKKQILNEMKERYDKVINERETDFSCKTMKTFTKQMLYYIKEIDTIHKNTSNYNPLSNKLNTTERLRVLMLTYKIYDILLDMKYVYWKANTFVTSIQIKLKEFYYNKPIPYINFAHYHRQLFNEELKETQDIKEYIKMKKKQFNKPSLKHKVKYKLCSICKYPGHNRRSCEYRDDRCGKWQPWKNDKE